MGEADGEDVTTGVGVVGTRVTTGVAVAIGEVVGAGDVCGGPTSKYVVAYEFP